MWQKTLFCANFSATSCHSDLPTWVGNVGDVFHVPSSGGEAATMIRWRATSPFGNRPAASSINSIERLMMRAETLFPGWKLNFRSGSWLYCLGGADCSEESPPTGVVVNQRIGMGTTGFAALMQPRSVGKYWPRRLPQAGTISCEFSIRTKVITASTAASDLNILGAGLLDAMISNIVVVPAVRRRKRSK